MTKKQFKKRWESSLDGGGITFDDVAECAVEWGISTCPRVMSICDIRYKVLKTASVNDAEEFNPKSY